MTLEKDLTEFLNTYEKLWQYDMSNELIQLIWINEKQIKDLISSGDVFR